MFNVPESCLDKFDPQRVSYAKDCVLSKTQSFGYCL